MPGTKTDAESVRIAPVSYTPPSSAGGPATRRVPPIYWIYGVAGLLLLAALILFSVSRAVRFDISPVPDSVDVSGGFALAVGDGRLLLPGTYHLQARKQGYEPLSADFVVNKDKEQTFRYALKRLPGKLTVISEPAGAELFVDDNARGSTPIADLELETGSHRLLLRAPRYEAFEAQIEIEGGGIAQTLNATLKPGWAPVSLDSNPQGAEILLDGESVGRTPARFEVGGGKHEIKLQLQGFRTWRDAISVRPNEPLQLATVKLLPASGNLQVSSQPSAAAVSVNGNYRGQTPLSLTLSPDKTNQITLSAPGHRPASRSLTVGSEVSEDLFVKLDPILGSVRLDITPTDATVKVDGQTIARGTTHLQLTATAHSVQVSKTGFVSQTVKVTPRPALEQSVVVELKSDAAAQVAELARSTTSNSGLKFVLVKAGGFTMGSARGTQGRQSNEPQRKVRLTRPFYLATTEVTNAQFRKFRSSHSSGIHARQSLDNERQPVVRVSWNDAVQYCNWLSAQDGLPAAYGADMKLLKPATAGYRLPTEAEWEWAARFAGGQNLRYPWGDAMPPQSKTGNYADAGASSAAPITIDSYEDGYVVSSAVASFAANPLGIFDLGGNVAEWTNDFYTGLPSLGGAEEADPTGPDSGIGHVVRGSSWAHGSLIQLRLAYRDFSKSQREDLGFRLARSVP